MTFGRYPCLLTSLCLGSDSSYFLRGCFICITPASGDTLSPGCCANQSQCGVRGCSRDLTEKHQLLQADWLTTSGERYWWLVRRLHSCRSRWNRNFKLCLSKPRCTLARLASREL